MTKQIKKNETKVVVKDVLSKINNSLLDHEKISGVEFLNEEPITDEETKVLPKPNFVILGYQLKPTVSSDDVVEYQFKIGDRELFYKLEGKSSVIISGSPKRPRGMIPSFRNDLINNDLIKVSLMDSVITDCVFEGVNSLTKTTSTESSFENSTVEFDVKTQRPSIIAFSSVRSSNLTSCELDRVMIVDSKITNSSVEATFGRVTNTRLVDSFVKSPGRLIIGNSNLKSIAIENNSTVITKCNVDDIRELEDDLFMSNKFDRLSIDLSDFNLPTLLFKRVSRYEYKVGNYLDSATFNKDVSEEELVNKLEKLTNRPKHTAVSRSITDYVITTIKSRLEVCLLLEDLSDYSRGDNLPPF